MYLKEIELELAGRRRAVGECALGLVHGGGGGGAGSQGSGSSRKEHVAAACVGNHGDLWHRRAAGGGGGGAEGEAGGGGDGESVARCRGECRHCYVLGHCLLWRIRSAPWLMSRNLGVSGSFVSYIGVRFRGAFEKF